MKNKTLRPWAMHTLEAIEGLILAIIIASFFLLIFYALTGFNLLWLIGLIGGPTS